MAGLYLHIPFCKQACSYCNFHFSTSLRYKGEMVAAIRTELQHRHHELPVPQLDTVYFGGGTPSLLTGQELSQLFETITALWPLTDTAEITLEANPDDLDAATLHMLRDTPINRLSIGIQSFAAADLIFMNRAHTAAEAEACLQQAQALGFTDLTVDLIYGVPTLSDTQWQENLRRVMDLGIPHLSAYALTVEPRTALAHQIAKGNLPPLDEEKAAHQFAILQEVTHAHGYEQYEISNFALPGRYARHNTAYWQGKPYLGVGPAAHSYDGATRRRWNIAHNASYLHSLAEGGEAPYTEEILSTTDRYNEYVMTALRTQWGADSRQIEKMGQHYLAYFIKEAKLYVDKKIIKQKGNIFSIIPGARFLADGIASDLFYID